jgi:hypothetical protein
MRHQFIINCKEYAFNLHKVGTTFNEFCTKIYFLRFEKKNLLLMLKAIYLKAISYEMSIFGGG